MEEKKIYIKNERFMEFIDELATHIVEDNFDVDVWKKVGINEYVFTDKAQEIYNRKYDMIENMLNDIMKVYSDNDLNLIL
tara:strand:- start:1080 stop:1319 length:240 start_codon:yes stop_codon:yes gene_type:complete